MADNRAPTPIIQNAIPVRYDPRVVVKPCEPDRVPYLPNDILYLIAKALPQPKQVFNLALASKSVWNDLERALYECEVTYEARLAHKYGGQSLATVEEHFAYWLEPAGGSDDDYSSTDSFLDWGNERDGDSDQDSVGERENGDDTASAAECPREDNEPKCDSEHCDECNNGRIHIRRRVFESEMPRKDEQFHVVGSMTALHWAAIQGTSALPVAREAIRAALLHQPSYISGLNLIKRFYRPDYYRDVFYKDNFADHPPPLFLAAAHGNLELFQELIYAGADTTLLLGRAIYLDGSGHYLMCSRIHQQCLLDDSSGWKCLFEKQLDSDVDRENEFLACQTIGHVAIQFGRTEMLQILLQNGLDVQRGSRPLLHSAVLDGNLAAVKALLAHDPNLVHSRHMGCTPMHMVPFMENRTGISVSEGQLESMVSCLLEHGASLGALAEGHPFSSKYALTGDTPLGSAFERLYNLGHRIEFGDEHRKISALQAANLFINMGVSRLPSLSDDHGTAPVSHVNRHHFLIACLKSAVLLVESRSAGDSDLWNSDFDSIRYRAVRKLWAQTGKNLIGNASEALSPGANSANKEAVQEMLHNVFRDLVDEADGSWQQEGIVGWWALEAVGELLLSTGMRPCGTTMRAWKRILKRDYEAPEPDRKVKLIQDCEAIDGDKSEWAFLSEGITFAKTEAAFAPGKHRHHI